MFQLKNPGGTSFSIFSSENPTSMLINSTTQNILPFLFFGMGVFGGAMQRIKTREGLKLFIACTVASLILATLLSIDYDNGLIDFKFFFYTFLFFVIFTSTSFIAREILIHISELTMLVYTVLFWYIYLTKLPTIEMLMTLETIPIVFLISFLFFSLLVFQKSLSQSKNSLAVEVLMYVWFIIINLFIFFVIFAEDLFTQPVPLSRNDTLLSLPLFKFIQGMAFFSVISNLTIIFNLIPLPSKNQTVQEKIKQIAQYMKVMSLKFQDQQAKPLFVFFLTILFSTILFVNYYLQVVIDKDLVYIILIIGSALTSFNFLYHKNVSHRK